MIVDSIENFVRYRPLGKRIAKALHYVHSTDFAQLAAGEYPLEGRELFATVSDYALKPVASGRLEAHRQYIDIQYLAQGGESIGYAPRADQKAIVEYEAEGDFAFYAGSASLVRLEQGMFAIFFPQDLHMPGIGDPAERVRKVVVKVRI